MAPFFPDLKLNGVNAGISITSSYVDPVGFFRGGNILCSCKVNAGGVDRDLAGNVAVLDVVRSWF
jgi:hypothetical protein